MRTLTTQQLATLNSTVGYSAWARVKVERSGLWYDLTNLESRDFLEEVSWSNSSDSPTTGATVRCKREVNGASLAPLMVGTAINTFSGAYSALLKEGRLFTVEAAVVPLGMEPTSSDWAEVFRGRIDEVDCAEDLVFTGRDYGWGLLQDTVIESEREYGSPTGVDVQLVQQDILDDNGLSAFTLYTPLSPSWALKKYVQKGEPVADALSALARQLGWEVRWKWLSSGPGTGNWRLWFWSPDRSATVPAWTYGPGEYQRLEEVRTSMADIRNVVEVVYSDRSDLDVAGNPKRKTVSVSDATSIAANGRRFMRIAEDATSNVDTSSEATTLANTGLADLKDAPLGVSFEVLFHPGLELGDLVKLEGNAVHFTADQTASVQSLTHTLNAGGATTKITLLGRPTIGRRTWLDMEQRPGIAPASPFTGPDAPSSLATAETVTGLRVRFTAPTLGPGAASYELHVSTTNGFTPSSSTCRNTSDATEFNVADLTPGTTYYVRVVPRDAKGNRGTASAQLTLTPKYVAPGILQPRVSWGVLPLNGDFEVSTGTSSPPDAWSFSGTWNTHAQTTTDVLSGKVAIHFPNTATTATLTGQPFTVREGEVWVFSCFYKQSVGTTASGVLAFTYLDANLGALSSVSVNLGASAATNTWTRAVQRVTIPAGARFGEVSFSRSGSYGGSLTVDSVDALRAVGWGAWTNVAFENSWSNANLAVYGPVQYRVNDLGEAEFRGMALAPSPAPANDATMFTLPAGVRPADYRRVFDRGTTTGTMARVYCEVTGPVKVSSIAAGNSLSLDGVRYFVS
ncbi:fibronectin type III domain-containing protein [Hyalangium sp.]|uniref:fibronectin type III domain-containing protein n=1 Tax=Hyalangium sp. TaxID=2028555 RepID=UPI002D229151|nr:fibronectin type III domain-containing protein [Hyalangium sp.]HYH96174.1 fibronectin type III domain-containing protein [Hyalangium sp.]